MRYCLDTSQVCDLVNRVNCHLKWTKKQHSCPQLHLKGQSPSGLPAGCRAWVQEDHLLCGAVRGDEWGQLLGLTDTFDNLVS